MKSPVRNATILPSRSEARRPGELTGILCPLGWKSNKDGSIHSKKVRSGKGASELRRFEIPHLGVKHGDLCLDFGSDRRKAIDGLTSVERRRG